MKLKLLNMLIPIELAIFDFDGVMIDSPLAWRKFIDGCFAAQTKYKPPADYLCRYNDQEVYKVMINKYHLPFTEDELREKIKEKNESTYGDTAKLIPEFVRYMNYLYKNYIKMSICTANSSSNLYRVLRNEINSKSSGWEFEYFQNITTQASKKNNPKVFKDIADGLNIPYYGCIVFDDTKAALYSAHEAGMKTCAVKSPVSDFTAKDIKDTGSIYIKSFSDLLDV